MKTHDLQIRSEPSNPSGLLDVIILVENIYKFRHHFNVYFDK